MTLVNAETGEILDATSAERRATKIGLRLDTSAENFEAAMEMMRAAIRDRDDLALGYRSPGDYLSDRFGGKLARLGVDLRREVVRELTEAGLSTRAIAPVVGISHMTVTRDLESGVTDVTPAPQTPEPAAGGEAVTGSGQAPEGEVTPGDMPPPVRATRPPVTGIDGKTYTAPAPAKAKRRPLPDAARDAGWDLRKSVERLERLVADDRFGSNKEQVATHLRSHLTNAIEVCQDLLDRISESGEA